MEIRNKLKRILPEILWPYFRRIDKHIVNVTYLYLSFRRDFKRINTSPGRHPSQQIFTFRTQLSFGPDPGDKLEQLLKEEGITCRSGRHSVYIFLKKDIRKIHKNISNYYPGPIGLKLIKSRQVSPDNTPYYTSSILAPASTAWSMKAIGSIEEKKAVCNLLHLKKVAPRVYDIVKIESQDGSFHFAFVVQHIDGDVLHGEEGLIFIDRFKKVLDSFGMETISITEHSDLRPPEFRNNIISNENGTWYVDIQNFVLGDKSFVHSIEKDALNYLSKQSNAVGKLFLTSRGDTIDWEEYKRLNHIFFEALVQIGVSAENAFIIFGTHSMWQFSALFALYSGALWCHFTKGSEALIKVLFLYGYTRFSYDSQIGAMYSLAKEHPDCFYRVFVCSPEDVPGLPDVEEGNKDILVVEDIFDKNSQLVALHNWEHLQSVQMRMDSDDGVVLAFYSRVSGSE